MCGRISTADLSAEALRQVLALDDLTPIDPRYNIAPSLPVPVVRQVEGRRVLEPLYWGLIPSWARDRDISRHTFNARSETVAEKPSFRGAFRTRRCLVPVSGFYEWKRTDAGKQPCYIRAAGDGFLPLAGLWEAWADRETGANVVTCAIITRAATGAMREVHHRMPVILAPENVGVWLDPKPESLSVVPGYFDREPPPLEIVPVSSFVNNTRNEGPECVAPASS